MIRDGEAQTNQVGTIGNRSTTWQLRTRTCSFGPLPLLMGIVNVTPDSFSDGGQYLESSAAIAHGEKLAAEGADFLDIGGESTRPYATPVETTEELRRVIPVIASLHERTTVPISIDTSKSEVAKEALQAGAEIINDITGFEGDSRMAELAVRSGAAVCAMHMQGTPQTMQNKPQYAEVVGEILEYLRQRRDALIAAGIPPERICLDPGIGFGKTHEHNLTLLANSHQFHQLGCPLLIGHSRKGYIANVLGNKERDRTFGTIGVSLSLARQGVQILRVHEVQATKDALLLFAATGGLDTL